MGPHHPAPDFLRKQRSLPLRWELFVSPSHWHATCQGLHEKLGPQIAMSYSIARDYRRQMNTINKNSISGCKCNCPKSAELSRHAVTKRRNHPSWLPLPSTFNLASHHPAGPTGLDKSSMFRIPNTKTNDPCK